MTLIINIGRRVERTWFKRNAQRVKGLISFRENIWMMIKQSLNLAKRKATASGTLKFVMTHDVEIEDMHYQLEWLKIIIQGTKEQEEEEYNESMQLYSQLNKVFKKEMPKDPNMMKHIKSKVLSGVKVEEAYKKGYGAFNDNNLANKLLEMGIITHIEKVDDFASRTDVF